MYEVRDFMDEISRAERARQDRLAEKPKDPEKVKDEKSPFDKILEENNLIQKTNPIAQKDIGKQVTEQGAREAYRREDRQGQDERREDKEKDKKGDQDSGGKKTENRSSDQRVVGKGDLKEGGGGGGREGRGGFSFGQEKRSIDLTAQKSAQKLATAALHGKFAEKLQSDLAKNISEPALTQSVLNQLVQYVKIGINKAGEKEIQIDLHEKIFRGLKLRVTSKEGKVNILFMAADAKTRAIFDKNKDAIKDTLEKKGILVEDINIT